MSNTNGTIMTGAQIKNLNEFLKEVTSKTVNWENYQTLANCTENIITNLIEDDNERNATKPTEANNNNRLTGIGNSLQSKGGYNDRNDYLEHSHEIDEVTGHFGTVAECLASANETQPSSKPNINEPFDSIAIYLQVHKVLISPFYHASLNIIISNDIADKYKDILYKAHGKNPYIYDFMEGYSRFTIGAGSIGGDLVAGFNREYDLMTNNKAESIIITRSGLAGGHNPNNLLESLISKTINFMENANVNYDTFPEGPSATGMYGYGNNSNSFISGLLEASGINTDAINIESNVPGWNKPVEEWHYT